MLHLENKWQRAVVVVQVRPRVCSSKNESLKFFFFICFICYGMIERFHRQLKSSLKAYNNLSNWTEHLPLIMLAIRCTIKEDIQSTPTELVYGSTLKLPGEFFHTEQNTSTNDITS
ncbi:Uncharacterised protein at_DN0825, partial [Pycnogonum litorale]